MIVNEHRDDPLDFAAADVNGDGALTQDEIAAYIKRTGK